MIDNCARLQKNKELLLWRAPTIEKSRHFFNVYDLAVLL